MNLIKSIQFGTGFLDHFSHLTPDQFYTRVSPTPVSNPSLLAWSEDLAADLQLPQLDSLDKKEVAEIFSGNVLPIHTIPFATRYGGHQFGHWAGQLGDGRAICLGELKDKNNLSWEVQLKGAGPTVYSRGADGRAVLRSSVREFICSEAMHHLGIPTTRALALVATGDGVMRDMFYDGHPEIEPGAIVTRVAPSFLRFGHFEIFAEQSEILQLEKLLNFTIAQYFPGFSSKSPEAIGAWFSEVCERTARLVVDWLRVGFVHGVMNTDNLSILGLTIDYGPFGWLDTYDPHWTPNTTDEHRRRYRFSQQPNIALWNLTRLAEALTPLVPQSEILAVGLRHFETQFQLRFSKMFAAKIGLRAPTNTQEQSIFQELDSLLQASEIDPTIFYRRLADWQLHSQTQQTSGNFDFIAHFEPALYNPNLPIPILVRWQHWLALYLNRLQQEGLSAPQVKAAMDATNPFIIPRNFLIQELIESLSAGDSSKLANFQAAQKTPYTENDVTRPYARRRPEWAKTKPGCSALSCSS